MQRHLPAKTMRLFSSFAGHCNVPFQYLFKSVEADILCLCRKCLNTVLFVQKFHVILSALWCVSPLSLYLITWKLRYPQIHQSLMLHKIVPWQKNRTKGCGTIFLLFVFFLSFHLPYSKVGSSPWNESADFVVAIIRHVTPFVTLFAASPLRAFDSSMFWLPLAKKDFRSISQHTKVRSSLPGCCGMVYYQRKTPHSSHPPLL